ncbi:hypothetical protein Slala01_61170 [Streptomyces lavendulae subsp. lavendulae]|nr:hypothetical protein Slala01_61170 [Streptomyces lavendulae subsp. lavendulae]
MSRLLDQVGTMPPLAITFVEDEDPPLVILATPHQLPLADQRLAVDRIAELITAVPRVHEVLSGRYGASVRGQWEDTVVIAITNAAEHLPGLPGHPDLPKRTTTTQGTADALRSLAEWGATVERDVDELVVTDQGRRHTVRTTVADEDAAQRVLHGLVVDADHNQLRPGRRYRALLPTGHLLSVSVDPK